MASRVSERRAAFRLEQRLVRYMRTNSDSTHGFILPRYSPQLFLLIHAVMLVLFLEDAVREAFLTSSFFQNPENIIDSITVGALFVLLTLGIRGRGQLPVLYGFSFSIAGLNVILTMAGAVEPMLLLDLMVLMALSLVTSFMVLPSMGVGQGLMYSMVFALQILVNSESLSWIPENIVQILGVYTSLILILGYFAHRMRSLERQNLMDRNRPAGAATRIGGSPQSTLSLVRPLSTKSGNAVAGSRNIRQILDEADRGLRFGSDLTELLVSHFSALEQDIAQMNRGIQVLASCEALRAKSGDVRAFYLDRFAAWILREYKREHPSEVSGRVQLRCPSDLVVAVNRDVLSQLLQSMFDYQRFSPYPLSDAVAELEFFTEGSELVIAYRLIGDEASFITAGPSGDPALSRGLNSELMLIDFIVESILGGSVEYSPSVNALLRLRLPLY